MKKINYRVIIVISFWSFLFSCRSEKRDKLFSDDVLVYENKSSDFMQKEIGFPFDEDCKNIFWYTRSGGLQSLLRLSKFECPSDKADAIIQKLIQWNDTKIGNMGVREIFDVPPFKIEKVPNDRIAEVRWWDLTSAKIIKAGISSEGFGLSFWISEPHDGNVTIYLYQSS